MKPQKTIGETIIAYRQASPESSCEEILAYVKKHFKGCSTTIGSVASTLSKACKRLGDERLFPGRIGRRTGSDDDEDGIVTYGVNTDEAEPDEPEETLEQATERIILRYDAMRRLAPKVINGNLTSLIISGPPGLSKSWTVKHAVDASGRLRHDGVTNVGGGGPTAVDGMRTLGWYDWISGSASAVGLYHAAWNMRNGGLIVLDDCDQVFRDEDSMNLLKIMTDSTPERMLSWRKNSSWLDEYGIEKTFNFRGHVIFLTNIDFEQTIQRDTRMTPHYKAFIDRAAYLCLTVRSARDFMIVLEEMAGGKDGFLKKDPYLLTQKQSDELFKFVRDNQTRFYNLSLRLMGQLAVQMKEDPEHWKEDATATKMRTV